MRVGSREHQAHRATFRPAVDGGTFGAGRVHHRADVIDPFFESKLGDSIGESLAALVEYDYPRESGEPFQQMLVARHLPEKLDVRESARDQDNVARAVTEDAVSDVHVATLRVLDLSFHGTRLAANLSRHYRKRHRKGHRCEGRAENGAFVIDRKELKRGFST